MIDDEKLQELLTKASSFYNNGEYQGAIQAWQEALTVDPASQKAREGIRMATLLLGDWESSARATGQDEAAAADGGPGPVSPEEAEARLEVGLAQVRQLLAERRHAEAVEGARGLLAAHAASEEAKRLLDEAQQALESAPFIEEHLTLARELQAQERFAEAEAECRKVFALDATHPGAQALLEELGAAMQQSLAAAASQMGGMTVKLSLPELMAAKGKPAPAPRAAAAPRPSAEPAPPDLSDLEQAFQHPAPAEATPQEEVAARAALDAAFEGAGVAGEAPAEAPPESPSDPAPDPAAPAVATPVEPEIIEAKTVRPASNRAIPSVPPAGKPGKKPAAGTAQKAAPGARAQPAAAAAASPDQAAPSLDMPAAGDEAAWESELTQLNQKAGEREILRGTAAQSNAIPVQPDSDVDLMSLLDTDVGGAAAAPQPPAAAAPAARPAPRPAPAKPAAARAKVEKPSEAPAEEPQPRKRRPVEPARQPPRAARSSPMALVFLLVGLLLAAGAGAAWHFGLVPPDLLQRRIPGLGFLLPASPPAGSPSGAGAEAPIPTPIGGSSQRQPEPIAPPSVPDGSAAVVPAPDPTAPAPGSAAPAPAVAPGAPPVRTPSPGAPAKPAVREPIKPPQPPQLSQAEIKRRVATYSAEGRRLHAAGRWREARAKFAAVLALDPINFEIKELADQAQSRIDDEQRLIDDLESAKKLITERDYENALRKLYRLPQNKGLGDINLYIRNAWFNWAVVLMKAGNAPEAFAKLTEALTLDPDDAEALRLQEIAEKYRARAKDRVYITFTEGLRLRPYDKR